MKLYVVRPSTVAQRALRGALVAMVATAAFAAHNPVAEALPAFTAPPQLVSTNPADTTPLVMNGRVQALAQVGDRIFVGGTFTAIRNAGETTNTVRTYLFAYDRLTGRIDTGFAPVLDAEVAAIEAGADGASIFVGGLFKNVNGVARSYLVKLDAATGATVTAYTAATNGAVYDIDSVGSRLFVTGWFTKIRGVARGGLAETNQTNGFVAAGLNLALATTRTAWGAGVRTVNVTPDASKLVIGGNFTTVGGVARDQLAIIDLTASPAAVKADWKSSFLAFPNPWTGTYIRDISISPDGSYFIVGTTWYCCPGNGDSLTRFDFKRTGNDVQPEWVNYTGSDTITSVIVGPNNVVYLGGHFRWMDDRYPANWPGRKARYGLAAVDAATGRSYEWAPTRERGYGVLALLLTSDGSLVIGHDSPTVGGEKHPGLASFPLTGGRTAARQAPPTLPMDVTVVSPGGAMTIRTFDGTSITAETAAPGLLGEVRSGFRLGNRLVAATSSGLWVYTPDAAGRWVRSTQLLIADVATQNLTSVAFRNEILFYTIAGDSRLHRRTMSSDSMLVDPFDHTIAGAVSFASVTGMFATAGDLYLGKADGTLQRIPFGADNELDESAAAVTVAGPAVDSSNWSGRLLASGAAPSIAYRPNLALGKPASQSSVNANAANNTAKWAVDGVRDGQWWTNMISATAAGTSQWWEVDLGSRQAITSVAIWGRTDSMESLMNPWIFVSDTPITGSTINTFTSATGVNVYKLNGFLSPGQEIQINRTRRYVRIATAGIENLGVQLAEVEVFGRPTAAPTAQAAAPGTNVAARQPASQSSLGHQWGAAERAVDGVADGTYFNGSVTHTAYTSNPWWQTDLGRAMNVGTIRLWNRSDCCSERLLPAKVFVSATPFVSDDPSVIANQPGVTTFDVSSLDPGASSATIDAAGVQGRYVRVQLAGWRILSLAEVEVLTA